MAKFTVTILDNETKEVKEFAFEGLTIMGVTKRPEDGIEGAVLHQNMSAKDIVGLMQCIEEDIPEVAALRLAGKLGSVFGSIIDDIVGEEECNCPKCQARRAEEEANA